MQIDIEVKDQTYIFDILEQRKLKNVINKKKKSKILFIQLQHTQFTYKRTISMLLLQIIYAGLVKRLTEAALIGLSTFSTFSVFYPRSNDDVIRSPYQLVIRCRIEKKFFLKHFSFHLNKVGNNCY